MRRTAAEIAAAALIEAFPNIELLGGGETPSGFFYDFHAPFSVHLSLIEEKMRQIVRDKKPIRTLEMLAFSASEMLESEGQTARAEAIEDEGLVEVIEIGSFHDLSPGPHLKNTAELAAFKISLETLPEQVFRIIGWCHQSKDQLKHFLKKLDQYIEPQQLGEQMGLWKGDLWLPAGLRKRQQLIQFFRKQWFVHAFEVAGPYQADRIELHRGTKKGKVAEIWSPSSGETNIQISFFNQPEEEMISCLQSIAKTLTILGFDHSTVPSGRETDYLVEDGLGRNQPVVRVKRISKKGSPAVDFCFTVVVEKILSLLLEKNLVMVELENQ